MVSWEDRSVIERLVFGEGEADERRETIGKSRKENTLRRIDEFYPLKYYRPVVFLELLNFFVLKR